MTEKDFVPYDEALELKELGFNELCFGYYEHQTKELDTISSEVCERLCKHNTHIKAPTFSQAINFLYICSNKQIDIELKASDTYEERLRKVDKGCEDLRNLQNSKPN